MPDPGTAKQASGNVHAACVARDVAAVRDILQSKVPSAPTATRELRTARRHPPLMRCLLENGAEPNELDIKSVVLYSSVAESFEDLKVLAEFGYDIKGRGHLVLQDFVGSQEILDWLLDHGVDINRTDPSRTDRGIKLSGTGAETDHSNHLLNRVAANGDIKLFDHLVSRGANPKNSFALHCATECKDQELSVAMIDHLLDKYQLDINADMEDLRDLFRFLPDSGTPLNNAIYYQNVPAIEVLLKRGADPNTKRIVPSQQGTGDHCFYKTGYLPALDVLLHYGADATSALYWATRVDNFEAVEIILSYGGDIADVLSRDQEKIEATAGKACVVPDDTDAEQKPMSRKMRQLLESVLGQ